MLFNEINILRYVSGVRLYCNNRAAIDFSWNKIDKTRIDPRIDLNILLLVIW